MKFAFSGDRLLSVRVLDHLLEQGHRPEALFVTEGPRSSHARELKDRCSFLPADRVFVGKEFETAEAVELLKSLDLDFIFGIHFPYIIRKPVLEASRHGFVNLHPAWLPFNRGWHTPSWAILDGTPVGATLHFMSEAVDEGDVIARKLVEVNSWDTAHGLYQRLLQAEYELFVESLPTLADGSFVRTAQDLSQGTVHKMKDLLKPGVQRIDLDAPTTAREVLRRLRGMTTSDPAEAAYYEESGRKVRVRVELIPENPEV
jgi:methionyl-tRNA formyltransferase